MPYSAAHPTPPPVSILFVDDEPSVLQSLRRLLSTSAFEVLTAASAEEALEILRQRSVDVLVSDIDMPGLSGLELVQIARREYPAMIRMLLTASTTLDNAVSAINEGNVARYFVKPFRVDLFRAALEGLADRIDRARRSGEESSHAARRRQLERWVELRFPGLLAVEGGASCVDIDAARLREVLEAVGLAALAEQLEPPARRDRI